jgi:hypothetical protein
MKILTVVPFAVYVYYYEVEDKKSRRLYFDHRPVPVGLLLDKVAVLQISSEYFGFLLSVSFHQRSVFIHSLTHLFFHSVTYHLHHIGLAIDNVIEEQT